MTATSRPLRLFRAETAKISSEHWELKNFLSKIPQCSAYKSFFQINRSYFYRNLSGLEVQAGLRTAVVCVTRKGASLRTYFIVLYTKS